MENLFDLTGQTLVITGSTSGIGLATARRFVQHGAKGVTISSRKIADCERLAGEINEQAGRDVAFPIAADLSDVASLERLVDRSLERWGRLDTVMGHAGAFETSLGSVLTIEPERFADMLVWNIRNNALLARRALPQMKKQGSGSIIFTASTAATGAYPFVGVYSVMKRALIQMVENMALELGPHHIRVNAISPSFTREGGSNASFWKGNEVLELKVSEFPIGRLGEPDDMAACAVYLSSKAGSFVTGRNHVVDGGYTLRQPTESDRKISSVV
ncbi:MAG: SDR family oxidoreductase [Caulobacteraceae bacterium]|nr:SDR family oxidoreductase [Caulobacteraceae bacterium]